MRRGREGRGREGGREKKLRSQWNFRLLHDGDREVMYSRERMIHVLGLLRMERILGHRGDNIAASLPRALIPT